MADKPYLLDLGAMSAEMRARLAPVFEIASLGDRPDRAAYLAAHGQLFTAVVTDGHAGVPSEVMEALSNLKIISSNGVGYDRIDANAAAARGIVVCHTPDVLNDEVADTAILLWLAVCRRLVQADAWARSGRWAREGEYPLTRSAQNRAVGIVGFGRIGQTIAARAGAFGATIRYHARSPRDVAFEYCPDLVDLARRSDVLIAITPGGAGTKHLISAEVMAALGPDGVLINVARGSVVDEAALVAALESGKLGGAGLDVFEAEPKIPAALTAMENVVLTPHVGSATIETRAAMAKLVCDNLLQFAETGEVLTPVPECRHLMV